MTEKKDNSTPLHQEVIPTRSHHVPQSIETPVTFEQAPGVYVRYTYSRSSDSMANQIDGQDFLCFKHNDQRFTAVICDGVGSSFCGNLAARILGENLIEWLWSLDIMTVTGHAALMESAAAYLNKMQKLAQVEVAEYQIPGEITGLIRQALESQRAYGSEAVFAACRIDHPSPSLPDGLVSILWMGDTHIEVLDNDGTLIELGGEFANADRWSTARGVRGSTYTWMGSLHDVGRIVAYTDGLLAHADVLRGYSDTTLDQAIRAGSKLPSSDDVAFIDMVIRSPFYEGYPSGEGYDPNEKRPLLKPIWNPTGEPVFELVWEYEARGKVSYLIQEAANPALIDAVTLEAADNSSSWKPGTPREPGNYYYRVRAIPRWGRMSPWSDLRMTRVAYPAPAAPIFAAAEPGPAPHLAWEVDGDALDFRLEAASDDTFSDAHPVYEGRNNEWAAMAGQFKPGVYTFRVRATSDGGDGPWSEPLAVEVLMPPPPVPHPGAISYDGLHGSHILRWQGSPGATHYEVRRLAETGEEVIAETTDTSWLLGELAAGEYTIAVRACHDFGCSAWSASQALSILPPAPEEAPALSLDDAGLEDGLITLRWTPVEGARQYLVEISESPDFANAQFQSVADTTFEMTRREPGLLHYRVAAENAGGEGPWSNMVSSLITPPAPDWIEVRNADEGGFTVSWGSVGTRAIYRVIRARADGGEEEIYEGPGYHVSDSSAPAEITLTYRVRAELPGIASGWRESAAVTRPAPAFAAPHMEAPQVEDGGMLYLKWSPVEGADSYLLEVSSSRDFSGATRTTESAGARGRFIPHAAGLYFFRVIAARSGEKPVNSPPSNIVACEVKKPAGPSLWPVDPVAAGESYSVTWRGVPNCRVYEVEEAADMDFTAVTATWQVAHPAQELNHPAAEAGRRYLRARAVYENGETSEWSRVIPVDAS